MGSVWLFVVSVGFWHMGELLPGWQVLDDLATNVRVILCSTPVPYRTESDMLLSSDREKSRPSCEKSGSFILLQARG